MVCSVPLLMGKSWFKSRCFQFKKLKKKRYIIKKSIKKNKPPLQTVKACTHLSCGYAVKKVLKLNAKRNICIYLQLLV